VTISEAFLTTVAEDLGFQELGQVVHKGEVLLCDPKTIYRIQTFLVSLCDTIGNILRESLDTFINHETKWKTARLLLNALDSSTSIKPKKRRFQKRKKVVDRVLEYVDADLSAQRSLSELCRVAEVDERTLRNIFYEQFSLSPTKYLKCHRLNMVRSALKRVDSSKFFIADIANDNGFWHMGQFAKDYKHLFGELPSTTLKRKPPLIS
jgi:transcriptional regulator GlxA family with amidase domain